MPTIELPPKTPGGPKVTIDDARAVVIVGANGTGKTRMGAYIENATLGKTHRIGAQRALVIPSHVPPRAYDQAQSQLHYGNYEPNWKPEQRAAQKIGSRWGGEQDVVEAEQRVVGRGRLRVEDIDGGAGDLLRADRGRERGECNDNLRVFPRPRVFWS
jgi:ATPase subunit of ABC transporter with duplicated ATPase domains